MMWVYEVKVLVMMLNVLNILFKFLIGCFEGNVFGGGVGMVLVCDVVLGIEGFKMGFIEVCFGLILVIIGFYVIVCMGEVNVCCVFMFGWLFDVDEVKDFGFLVKIVVLEEMEVVFEVEVKFYMVVVFEVVVWVK